MAKSKQKLDPIWKMMVNELQKICDDAGLKLVEKKENGQPTYRFLKKDVVRIEVTRHNQSWPVKYEGANLYAHRKTKNGGYAFWTASKEASSIHVTTKDEVAKAVKWVKSKLKLKKVPTTDKKEPNTTPKLKQIADVGEVDLLEEWNTPFKIIKFKTYIYSDESAANPNSKVEVRCDIWVNHVPELDRLVEPDNCTDRARKYRNSRIHQAIKYFSKVMVDIDRKEFILTESHFNGFELIVDNADEVVERICGVLSGLKEH